MIRKKPQFCDHTICKLYLNLCPRIIVRKVFIAGNFCRIQLCNAGFDVSLLSHSRDTINHQFGFVARYYFRRVNNERIGSAIIFLGTITAMLIGLAIFVPFDSIEYLHEFNFGHYALVVAVPAGATLFKELFVNIQQVKGRFYAIALTEIGSAIILLTPFFFFQGETLIYVSLLMMASIPGSRCVNFIDWYNQQGKFYFST